MIEKEIKVMLTEKQYEEIKTLFQWSDIIYQVNHYYVNSGTNNEKRLTIRVRDKNSKHFLQIKRSQSEESSLHVSEEYEKEIDSVPELIPSEILTELTGFHIPDSVLIGSLSTERRLCNDYSGLEICLDKVWYYDVVEYELELEYTGEYPEAAVSLLKERGISFDENVNGKYCRFLNYVNSAKPNST